MMKWIAPMAVCFMWPVGLMARRWREMTDFFDRHL
jgi:hypothetical protein